MGDWASKSVGEGIAEFTDFSGGSSKRVFRKAVRSAWPGEAMPSGVSREDEEFS